MNVCSVACLVLLTLSIEVIPCLMLPLSGQGKEKGTAVTDDELWDLVEQLLGDDPSVFDKLQESGERAVPSLIKALNDPRFLEHEEGPSGILFKPKEEQSPIEKVFQLIRNSSATEANQSVARLCFHESTVIRNEALHTLGSLGSNDGIATIERVLRKGDSRCVTRVMLGINECLLADRGSNLFREKVFAAVTEMIRYRTMELSSIALRQTPNILFEIDVDRAKEVLLHNSVFFLGSANFNNLLVEFNENNILIPHEILDNIIKDLPPDAELETYYGNLLLSMAMTDHPLAANFVQNALSSENDRTLNGASKALLWCNKIPDPSKSLPKKINDSLPLTSAESVFIAVENANWKVSNGGPLQLFQSEKETVDAISGLKMMDGTAEARILEEGYRRYLNGDQEFDHLGQEFCSRAAKIRVKLAIFAVLNRSDFVNE